MKNAEQLIKDFKEDEELRKKIHEALNKLRNDENLSVIGAGSKVARELGYEISNDEAKNFITSIQNRKNSGKTQLADEDLENVAGGKHDECNCATCECNSYLSW